MKDRGQPLEPTGKVVSGKEKAITAGEQLSPRAIKDDVLGVRRSGSQTTLLMALRPSPVTALNRAIAIAQQHGPEAGPDAIRQSSTASGSRAIRSLPRRSVSSSFAPAVHRRHTATFGKRGG